ncbi:MAG: hypothetical protein ACRENE_11955, partial [Polyangiaceae bacterium]
CSLVPPNVNGQLLPHHMLALVTQAARGEVAVVDLTGNYIVDESKVLPGTNFIPVGSQPTGIVVAPDANMTFVASADPNKPAIYGIPTNAHTVFGRTVAGVLGDSTQLAGSSAAPAPLTLVDLPACALPQPPQTISVARVPPDGYVIVATLQPSGTLPAAVVAIDPRGLVRGGTADPGAAAGSGGGLDGGPPPAVTPGVLGECPILGATLLSDATGGGSTVVPWSPGPAWADGVPYADAGDLSSAEPRLGASCTAPSPSFDLPSASSAVPFPAHAVMRDDAPLLYVADGELPEIHVIDVGDPAHPVEQAPLLATSIRQAPLRDSGMAPPQPVSVGAIALSPVTREYKRFLYAIDQSDGSIMVFEVTDPVASPRTPLERPHPELDPLSPRDRIAFASPVASLAFATHDWPVIPPGPGGNANADQVHAYAGLLCNPNPNAGDGGTTGDGGVNVLDYGYYYTAQQAGTVYSGGTEQAIPLRLRGVFAFATLTTGQVITIDVDDWDAPCRRPDPMASPEAGAAFKMTTGMTGVLALPQSEPGPPGSPTFLDPYSAPFPEPSMQASSVTQEAFFPVSAPHRMRSMFLLRNDPMVGNNAPNILAPPALTDVSGTSVAASNGGVPALILPTTLPQGFIDPSLVTNPTGPLSGQQLLEAGTEPGNINAPGVRLSFDDPTVALNQVWSVTYEGALPTLDNVTADILAPGADAGPDAGGGYSTLTFSIGLGIPGADAGAPLPGVGIGFCERGVEDWDQGQARAQQALDAMDAGGLPAPPQLEDWTADYIEITDDPLPQGDKYWNVPNSCWEGLSTGKGSNQHDLSPHPDKTGKDSQTLADERYNVCNQVFGTGAPDSFLARDLPILRAYDDHLDVGRFAWPTPDAGPIPELTTNRTIVGPDPSNGTALRFVACCFRNQAAFKVRAGGEWLATGQTTGLLHHVVASPTPEADPLAGGASSLRCVQSCDPHDVLLNSRSVDVPWGQVPWNTFPRKGDAGAGEALDAGEGREAGGEGGIAEGGSDGGSGLVCAFPHDAAPIDRNSVLALRNPFFSYVTWMACVVPASPYDHTVTLRDDAWHFQLAGGFSPLTTSLTSNTILDISPQSMRYIQPLGWMAVIDGQSQGLQIIDLDNPASVARTYF